MHTVIDLYDVFRTDIFPRQEKRRREFFSTVAADYISKDGFYI